MSTPSSAATNASTSIQSGNHNWVRWLPFALIAVLAVMPLLPFVPEYWITLGNYIGIYTIATLGLLLLTGKAGLTSFGQAAFVGLGAYCTALLSTKFAASPFIGLFASLGLTGASALFLGLITVRLSGHYLPLCTIAWGLSLYYLFGNMEFLGKFDGITGIPAFTMLGMKFETGRELFYVIWFCALVSLFLINNLLDSRPGRVIRALKKGAIMQESHGIDTAQAKLVSFVIAALMGCVAGWLYAYLQRAVNPTPFGLNYGIEFLFMAVVGGMGSVWGALIGAALVTVIKNWLQGVLPNLLGATGNFEMIVFGIGMVVLLQRAPDGVWAWLQALATRLNIRPSPRAIDLNAPAFAVTTKPAPGTVLLDVQTARKTFGGLVAVNDVSFSVQAGQIVALIGPNGAGKSTMFNLVSGVASATSGKVMYLGKDITQTPARKIARAGMGRTFQHVRLVPDMTVLENVAIGAHLHSRGNVLQAMVRANKAQEQMIFAQAAKQLERVGLGAHLHQEAGSLALGQQRTLEIARALCLDPTLLLLDEPAAGLRYQEKQALAQLLSQLRAQGLGVLLVEHDMDFVMGLVDHVVVMDFGTRIAQGAPAQVRNDPAVLQAYLGGVD